MCFVFPAACRGAHRRRPAGAGNQHGLDRRPRRLCRCPAPGRYRQRGHHAGAGCLLMAAYLDTSFLVPLFFHETASAAVLVRARSESELWISHWTLAEFSSAVAFKLRTGQTDENTSRQATARLQAILTGHGLIVAEVRATDFERAAQFCAAQARGGHHGWQRSLGRTAKSTAHRRAPAWS